MARKLQIAQVVRVASVAGLVPPAGQPDAHVFLWTLDGTARPDYLRWCWHPLSGDMVAGVLPRHVLMLPTNDPERPFESWLRGFVFRREKLVAVRTYFWPLGPDDDWGAAHATLDRRVFDSFVALMTPLLPGFKFVGQIDNRWLAQNFSRYASSW